MQDIININNKMALPLLILVLAEVLVSGLNILMAIIFAVLHAVFLYANTVAAVKEARMNEKWFPTILFRNTAIVTVVIAGIAALLDVRTAVCMLLMGVVTYVLLGLNIRIQLKRPANAPRSAESCKPGEIVGYKHR